MTKASNTREKWDKITITVISSSTRHFTRHHSEQQRGIFSLPARDDGSHFTDRQFLEGFNLNLRRSKQEVSQAGTRHMMRCGPIPVLLLKLAAAIYAAC